MNKEEYKLFLKSDWWQDFKFYYWQCHIYECQKCGVKKNIELHHLRYSFSVYDTVDSDIMPLCRRCHSRVHSKGYFSLFLKIILCLLVLLVIWVKVKHYL